MASPAEVQAFAGALSLLTGIAFGLFPALHCTRPDLVTALRNNSGKLARGRAARRFRSSLATAQIALAMTLSMGAGQFLKSLWKVSQVELGMRVEKLVTFALSPEKSGYDSVRTRALFARVEEELAALPGAAAVTSSMVPLIAGSNWNNSVSVEGFKAAANTRSSSSFNAVGVNHFRTIDVDLLAGREFTAADDLGRPKVAIVNEAFARKFGLGANPVGKRMAQGSGDTVKLDMEIVGLVRDAKYSSVKRETPPVFFEPHRQVGDAGQTLLASIGLYGVLAYSVAQRTREIGVRMALGAGASRGSCWRPRCCSRWWRSRLAMCPPGARRGWIPCRRCGTNRLRTLRRLGRVASSRANAGLSEEFWPVSRADARTFMNFPPMI